ncbi:MAG: class I SAM-dependent methyltransferase [Chlamydiae bacterium]|nr:class I SAM-dependent methyltransferase [Chlamydiota bacterium]MBI3266456.1 class I SAM-dependent methyltransferase [Chlamydiota bacterium]
MSYPILKNRMDLIGPLVKDKTILDLGCVDHYVKQLQGSWMHRELKKRAKEVTGVDHLPEAIEQLQKMGYHVVCQDVEKLNLHQKFDIVVAGEIIEHLKNPGLFLEGVQNHLKEDGLLILTTPNPFSIAQFFKILKRNQIKVNVDHTTWFDPQTLQVLLTKNHFQVKEIYWLNDFKRFWIRSLWAKFRPYFHDGFLVVCEKRK